VNDGTSVGEVAAVLDNDPDSFWTTTDNPQEVMLTVDLPAPVRANLLMLQEHIASGQRVEAFELEIFKEGEWQPVANGTTVGYKSLLRFADSTFSRFRIRFTQFRIRPTVSSLGLFFTPPILSAPKITRDSSGMVTIKPPTGTFARYTLDGSEPTDSSPRYLDPISLPNGGVVTAQTFPLSPDSEVNESGNAFAQAQFGLAKAKWKIVDCDSHDGDEGQPSKEIDDNPATYWHTRFRDKVDAMPHHVTVDMGEVVPISGFIYTPRQDQWEGGIITQAKFEVSEDGENWISAVDGYDFDNIVNSRKQQTIKLPEALTARYFRLTALQTAHNNDFASAAEISVLVE
jgi:alpha-L-fucosidase